MPLFTIKFEHEPDAVLARKYKEVTKTQLTDNQKNDILYLKLFFSGDKKHRDIGSKNGPKMLHTYAYPFMVI